MKLAEVFAANDFTEYSPITIQQSVDWISNNGMELTKLEGGKFSLIQAGEAYALRKESNSEIIAWAMLGKKEYLGISGYELNMVYVVPSARNGAATSVLVFAAKQYLGRPIFINGPVSTDGQKLISALSRRHLPIKLIDLTSRTIGNFDTFPDFSTHHDKLLMIESTPDPLIIIEPLPGGNRHVIAEYFHGVMIG